MNISLAQGRLISKWPEEVVADYRKQHGRDLPPDFNHKRAGDKACEAFPALRGLGASDIDWRTLQYLESRAIVATLLALMRKNVPALPIHDSIIVPESKVRMAAGVFFDTFYQTIGAPAKLKTKSTLPGVQEALREALTTDERWCDPSHL